MANIQGELMLHSVVTDVVEVEDSQVPERPGLVAINQTDALPPPTWWLPRRLSANQQPVMNMGDPAPVHPPDPPVGPAALPNELNQPSVRRSQ
ncbi:hypothetical protein SRHO_G00232460 [Serrasalmus rhombeus]